MGYGIMRIKDYGIEGYVFLIPTPLLIPTPSLLLIPLIPNPSLPPNPSLILIPLILNPSFALRAKRLWYVRFSRQDLHWIVVSDEILRYSFILVIGNVLAVVINLFELQNLLDL